MALHIQRSKAKKSGHTRAVAPTISLDQPGRLRVAHVLALLSVSHSTLYAGMRRDRYPKPDGYDGNLPYWTTQTIREFCAVHKGRSIPLRNRKPRTVLPPEIFRELLSGHLK